jgi:hypothetical protein
MEQTQDPNAAEREYYHRLYEEHSPEYRRILATTGRMLTPAQVQDILDAHSIPLDELLADHVDNILGGQGLPERLDACMLLAWLGY